MFEVADHLFTVGTLLFSKSCAQVNLCNMQSQVEFTIGCIIAKVTHFVPYPIMYILHVNQHSTPLCECLVTLWTWHFDSLGALLST